MALFAFISRVYPCGQGLSEREGMIWLELCHTCYMGERKPRPCRGLWCDYLRLLVLLF